MEAPKPIEPESADYLKEEKNYSINSQNKNYNINIKNYYSYIIIDCFYLIDENKKVEFENKYFIEEFKNNKYLSICDSIDEVYSQLKIEFEKKNIIINENKEEIIIIIPINHIKLKDINFILSKKTKNEKEIYEDLKIEISFLKKENQILKTSIEKLEKQNKLINDNLTNLNKDNKILLEKISKLEKMIEDNNNKITIEQILSGTKILADNIKKQKRISNWIKEKTKKNEVNFELIFRIGENGEDADDFHKYCDNKGPTLTLIKTTKNYIIGGFTPLNWENDEEGNSVSDDSNQTFIFSINLNKRYDLINSQDNNKAIYIWKIMGPSFGNGDLKLTKNLREGHCYDDCACSFIVNGKRELVGDGKFTVQDLEVFKVKY